jgi:hypothetical protein
MVWEGKDAVKTGRTILGATNPLASAPGTIRGDFAIVSKAECLFLCFCSLRLIRLVGCRPQRLPRIRHRRERPEGDCALVRED